MMRRQYALYLELLTEVFFFSRFSFLSLFDTIAI